MADLVDDIKVEVELPPEEGDNLLTNTSGQYGAWQWGETSGTSGVTITGDPVARTIKLQRNAVAGFSGIITDFVPVTPGKYANARIDLTAITSGHKVTLGLQFYDSAYTVISWQYSSPSSTLSTLAFSSVSIPANTAYARLAVILDKTADPLPDSGSANANAQVTFTKAMITEISTSGVPSVVLTNLMPNGGFQHVTTGWSAGTNIGAISRTTPGGGQYYLRGNFVNNVSLSNAEFSYINGPLIDVEGGAKYSFRVDTSYPSGLPAGHSFTTGFLLRWYDASSVQIGADTWHGDGDDTAAVWHQVWKIITAPAAATKARIYPYARHYGPTFTLTSAWYFQTDSISIVKSSVLQPYFDGDTPDTSSAVYAWTGTAGNSTSTRTSVGAVDYVEPDEQFLDITGGYNQFTIERSELDISTCNGTIVDPALSPARADSVLVPGRGIRVWAYRPEIEDFERLFTGTLGPCSVEYDPLEDEKRQKVKISVTSVGPESTLAQASRPDVTRTPANLADLVLSGAGVPWDINGSSNLVGGVGGIATNENASALDQVALTRDTQAAAYAWVAPYGTLVFRSSLGAKSTGPATMGPTDYSASGLKVSFSTERLINSVNVVRVIRASDGSTEERQHGPYEDGASIRRWGRSSATVTIASIPNDTAAADTKGAAVLAANAIPTRVIEEVVVNSADNRDHAFHDLYDLLTVSADTIDGAIETDTRITRIRHEFTTEARPFGRGQGRWHTTYGFMADGGIASPAIQPPTATTSAQPRKWAAYTTTSTNIASGAWTTVSGYATGFPGLTPEVVSAESQPFTYGAGVITAVVNCWVRVHFAAEFANNTTGRRGIRLRMSSDLGGTGSNAPAANFQDTPASGATPMPLETFYSGPLAAGQTLTTQVYQNSGAALAVSYRGLTIEGDPLA